MIRKTAKKRRQNPDKPLTNQMLMFVREYIACELVGYKAAINAGYSPKTADQQASRLLRMVKVQEAIAAALKERTDRLAMDADKLLKRWTEEYDADVADLLDDNNALKPVKDWPTIWRKGLIAGVKVKQLFDGDGKLVGNMVDVKLADRHTRAESIARHIAVQAYKEQLRVTLSDPMEALARSLMGDRIMPKPQAALPAPVAKPK